MLRNCFLFLGWDSLLSLFLSILLSDPCFKQMQKMLKYNPAERIAAKTALDHPYFDSLDKSQFWSFILPYKNTTYLRVDKLFDKTCYHHLGESKHLISVAFRHISAMFELEICFLSQCKTQWFGNNGKIASLRRLYKKTCCSTFLRCRVSFKWNKGSLIKLSNPKCYVQWY